MSVLRRALLACPAGMHVCNLNIGGGAEAETPRQVNSMGMLALHIRSTAADMSMGQKSSQRFSPQAMSAIVATGK